MKPFLTIINKIKHIKVVSKDSEVAKILGMNPKTFALRKMRGSIPYEELIAFCKTENLSTDEFLIDGFEGARNESNFMVKEGAGPYRKQFVSVPQVLGQIGAGGGLVPDNTIEIQVAFRRDWIQKGES